MQTLGESLQRIKGGHYIFSKPGERKITAVPVHGNHEVKPGLAKRIARDTGIGW